MPRNSRDPLLAVLLAALLGGGSTSLVLPKVAPNWYRPDPATGTELSKLKHRVDQLATDMHAFLREGPLMVRRDLGRVLTKLEAIEGRLARIEQKH